MVQSVRYSKMATIGEPVTLSEIRDSQHVVSVESSGLPGHVILTLKSNVVNVFEVENQKAVKSWSFRTGQQLTSPVLWDTQREVFITVINNQEIKQWKREDTRLDKASLKHYKFKIHKALTVNQLEPIIVCENGAVDFISAIKDKHSEGSDLSPDDRFVYCDVCCVKDDVCVVCLLQRKEKLLLMTDWYTDKKWHRHIQTLDVLSTDDLVCCQCSSTSTDIKVYLLSKKGTLLQGVFSHSSPTAVFHTTQNIEGVSIRTSFVVLDTTHIAIAGCHKESTDIIGIFDIKFGTFQAWKQLPEKTKSAVKLFSSQNHLFLAVNKTLYTCSFVCQSSTVASILGQKKDLSTDHKGEIINTNISWSKTSKQRENQAETSQTVASLLSQLSDKSKKPTEDDFLGIFDELLSLLPKRDSHVIRESTCMMQVIDRCINEKSFWPRSAIQKIIRRQLLPTGGISGLFDALIAHSESLLLYEALQAVRDVPENCLCKVLEYIIGCDDSKIEKAVTEVEVEWDAVEAEHNQSSLSSSKRIFLVLTKTFNDVFLLESLRSLTFKNVLILLEYLSYLLGDCQSEGRFQLHPPSMLQVVTWICLLIDAHVTQLIISPDSRLVLVSLHKLVESQAEFYSELVTLEALLQQLKEKCTIPKKKLVGEYCIEVLHVL